MLDPSTILLYSSNCLLSGKWETLQMCLNLTFPFVHCFIFIFPLVIILFNLWTLDFYSQSHENLNLTMVQVVYHNDVELQNTKEAKEKCLNQG